MNSTSPTRGEVLNALRAGIFRDLHVAMPGRVEKFDASTQLADVKPLIHGTYEQEDGTITQAAVPVVPAVPVSFPAAGGFAITLPLQVGDTGLLVFIDRSMDVWQSEGGDSAPVDLRRHHLSDAVFIPGIHPNNAALPTVDASAVVLGLVNGSAEPVLKGSTYRSAEDSYLTAMVTAIKAALSALSLSSAAATLDAAKLDFDAGASGFLSTSVKVKG